MQLLSNLGPYLCVKRIVDGISTRCVLRLQVFQQRTEKLLGWDFITIRLN